MKGRKPKSNHLKLLDGNPSRAPIKKEPIPPEGMPKPPPHLDSYAVEEWNRHAKGLYAMGLLSMLDSSTFGAYCMAYSRWRAANEILNELAQAEGAEAIFVNTLPSGAIVKNPIFVAYRQSAEDMVKFGADFGLSAVARTRLAVDIGKSDKSKFDGLIGGKK